MKKKKSPLKSNPLRHAGQSLDEEIEKSISEHIAIYAFAIMMFAYLIIMEWYRWYMQSLPSPVLMTLMAFPLMMYAIYKLIKEKKKLTY